MGARIHCEDGQVTITVIGMPGPQGSKRFMGVHGGKGIMLESSALVRPWREAVKYAARQPGVGVSLRGALSVRMVFTLPRPKSSPKSRRFPDRKPDLSKLVRSTEDALTDAGIWEDDARVVKCTATKVFPNGGVDALDVPGCVITIEAL